MTTRIRVLPFIVVLAATACSRSIDNPEALTKAFEEFAKRPVGSTVPLQSIVGSGTRDFYVLGPYTAPDVARALPNRRLRRMAAQLEATDDRHLVVMHFVDTSPDGVIVPMRRVSFGQTPRAAGVTTIELVAVVDSAHRVVIQKPVTGRHNEH